ncbi:hypothetical protein CCACVL1_02452 [Corchorus capsularis]|uniref:Uncharacterized protein n=1 Tax=Corchorus capsularis TaxID=210143 RepID=A0A1R3K8F1_COCAP|nr:hypothetical protein CCACVL1_02452 [Corchorus capsularis]
MAAMAAAILVRRKERHVEELYNATEIICVPEACNLISTLY